MGAAIDLIAVAMRDGGPVMWPIALCSFLVVVVTLRKALQWVFHRLAVRAGAEGWGNVLRTLRDEGIRIIPRCSYIIRYIERHPEWQEMVAATPHAGQSGQEQAGTGWDRQE